VPNDEYPLVLNTGRIRDQWHTMTRTGKSPRLSTHIPEVFVQVNPADATVYDVKDNELIEVSSRWGKVVSRCILTEDVQPGMVFIPMHWNDQFSSEGSADALVSPAIDPVSGQPEFKHTPVKIKARKPAWYGFLLSRRRFEMAPHNYWNLSKGYDLWRYEMAGDEIPDDWAKHARSLLCSNDKDVAWSEYFDRGAQRYRAARLVGHQLESCIFIGPDHDLPNRDWLMALFTKQSLTDQEKSFLLSGRPGDTSEDAGASVCACYGVGRNTIIKAIQEKGLSSVEAIGKSLQAGTNCGSCLPELKALLEENSG
jgi:assimilatory nitrate reductase catalytic subunit